MCTEQHELVSAKPSDGVRPAGDRRQPSTDLAQYAVSRVMAQGVIDLLEVVEVDEQQPYASGLALEGHECLCEMVHQRQAVGQAGQCVVQGLMGERFFGRNLRGHVAGRSPGADDAPVSIEQRQLDRRDPGIGAVVVCLPLELCAHRLAGIDHALLVLEGGDRVRRAEDVEIRLADYLVEWPPVRQARKKARAHKQKAAIAVLEEDAFLGIRSRLRMHRRSISSREKARARSDRKSSMTTPR